MRITINFKDGLKNIFINVDFLRFNKYFDVDVVDLFLEFKISRKILRNSINTKGKYKKIFFKYIHCL